MNDTLKLGQRIAKWVVVCRGQLQPFAGPNWKLLYGDGRTRCAGLLAVSMCIQGLFRLCAMNKGSQWVYPPPGGVDLQVQETGTFSWKQLPNQDV